MPIAARERAAAERRLFPLLLGALIVLAWLSLWLWGRSPYSRYLSHHSLEAVRGGGLLLLVFLAGWTLMVVAMMLPTSLPLVALFHRLTARRAERSQLIALLLGGYLAVWGLFGGAVYLGDWGIHRLVARSAGLEAQAWAIGAATLLLAGGYQFTPLKRLCLERCRSPLSFIVQHWRGRHAGRDALRLGAHHGLFCLGCCWSLMLVMFAVGVGNLGWMLVLGAVMGVEKNLPWGHRLSAPLGVVLIALGMATAYHAGRP